MRQTKAENLLQAGRARKGKEQAGGGVGKTSLRCVVLLLLMALRTNSCLSALHANSVAVTGVHVSVGGGGVTLIFD